MILLTLSGNTYSKNSEYGYEQNPWYVNWKTSSGQIPCSGHTLSEFNQGIVLQAISRELKRGGPGLLYTQPSRNYSIPALPESLRTSQMQNRLRSRSDAGRTTLRYLATARWTWNWHSCMHYYYRNRCWRSEYKYPDYRRLRQIRSVSALSAKRSCWSQTAVHTHTSPSRGTRCLLKLPKDLTQWENLPQFGSGFRIAYVTSKSVVQAVFSAVNNMVIWKAVGYDSVPAASVRGYCGGKEEAPEKSSRMYRRYPDWTLISPKITSKAFANVSTSTEKLSS